MDILNQAKESFNEEIYSIAKTNIKRKLKKQGIESLQLSTIEFDALVEDEIEILKSDSKKVGAGVGIGFVLSMLLGF